MHDFFLIYKAQILSVFASGKKRKKTVARRALGFGGIALIWLFVFAFVALYEYLYASFFASVGAVDTFPVIMFLLSSVLTLTMGISYTKNLIFCSKDHDRLASLPVPSTTIIAAKIATVYTMDLVISLTILLPAGFFYTRICPGASFLLYLPLAFFAPMIPILLSVVLAVLVSLFASRMRHANVIGTVIYVALFIGLMVGIYSSTSMEATALMEMLWKISDTIRRVYPPADWFFLGFSENRTPTALLLFFGVSLVAFFVVVCILGKFYTTLRRLFTPRIARTQYKAEKGASGIIHTMVKKDFRRYISASGLLLNQTTGSLMLVIMTIMVFLRGDSFAELGLNDIFAAILPALIAMITCMSSCTNSAISLEGKTMSILKSLPVSPNTILRAKLVFHLYMNLPIIGICSLLISLRLGLSWINTIPMLLTPIIASYMIGVLGLLLNLKKYNFAWTSEVMVAKNSMPVVVTMFGGLFFGMLMTGVSAVIAVFLGTIGTILAPILVSIIYLILAVTLRIILHKIGPRLFQKIEF